MKKDVIVFAAMTVMLVLVLSASAQTQNVLGDLTFEEPTKLIRPTGVNVNVRERPAANAPKAKNQEGWDVTATKHKLYYVNTELPAWWSTEDGYISKKVAKESVGKPITDDMLNRFYGWSEGYDSASEWMVSRTASKYGFVVCYTSGDGWNTLWLGKQVGNVFVFKYRIFCTITVDENNANPKYFNLHQEDRDDFTLWTITVGKNFIIDVPWGGMGTTKTLDLRKLNDKAILELFKSAIEKWSWRDGYFYLNSDLLSSEYANYVLG
jgi:hypothetical protein